MKTIILNSDISEEKAFILSKIFANKLPFFGYINYGYQIIDGRVNVLNLNNRVSNGNLVINYDNEDSVRLNVCGIYHIIIEDITFEKII